MCMYIHSFAATLRSALRCTRVRINCLRCTRLRLRYYTESACTDSRTYAHSSRHFVAARTSVFYPVYLQSHRADLIW